MNDDNTKKEIQEPIYSQGPSLPPGMKRTFRGFGRHNMPCLFVTMRPADTGVETDSLRRTWRKVMELLEDSEGSALW